MERVRLQIWDLALLWATRTEFTREPKVLGDLVFRRLLTLDNYRRRRLWWEVLRIRLKSRSLLNAES